MYYTKYNLNLTHLLYIYIYIIKLENTKAKKNNKQINKQTKHSGANVKLHNVKLPIDTSSRFDWHLVFK